jgi:hypothetical protein
MPAANLEKVLEIPLALSALKSCIHGLLGIGGHPGFERAEEVLVELLALRDTFPFDLGRGADGEAPVSLFN